jgi:membrane-bound lytic murein transglycosylase B
MLLPDRRDDEDFLMAVNLRVNSKTGIAATVPMVLLLAASVLAPRPAAAQNALTADQVRVCLCEQQAMTVLRQRVDTAKATYDERTQREQRLTQQIEQLQSSTAATDLATQDQIRELLDLRGRVSRDRMQTALPAWQQAARNLDAVVKDYNANCLKPMYRTDIEQAQANLMCPPVP